MARIAVFGLGYVGCVSAACLARDGHHVVGVDCQSEKVCSVQQGLSPVVEPGLDELIHRNVSLGRLEATSSADQAVQRTEMALICVGTPSCSDGSVSINAVRQVFEQIITSLMEQPHDYTIILRSTVLPGILEEQLVPMVAACQPRLPERIRIKLYNHPEFLRETSAIKDYDHPPFILFGAQETHRDVPAELLALYPRHTAPIIITDSRTAAMVKYACNAFHALKVAFANEIGTLAAILGAHGEEVMRILCMDHQLNVSPAYLKPGFAFGGSCLPKDLRALTREAQKQGVALELLSSILVSNRDHALRGFDLITRHGKKKIGLIGLSFKAGTDDLRESPLVSLAESLIGKGYSLRIYDPWVRLVRLTGRNKYYVDEHLPHLSALLVSDEQDLYSHSDLLVIGTDVVDSLRDISCFDGPIIDLRRDLIKPL